MNKKYIIEESDIRNYKVNYYFSIIFVLSFIFILLFLSSYIKYSQKIEGNVRIISEINSFNLYSPNTGRIVLMKKDKQNILQNDVIAYIDNPASFQDVSNLNLELKKFNIDDLENSISNFRFNSKYNLGSIQEYYYNFIISINEYKNLVKNNIFEANINKYSSIIFENQKELNLIDKVKNIQKSKFRIFQDNYYRDSILNKKEIITKIDFNNSNIQYLNYKENILQNDIRAQNIKSNNIELVQEIKTLKTQSINNISTASINIKRHYFNLINAIRSWEQNFIIKSPVDGLLQYASPFISNLMHVQRENNLFFILPDNNHLRGKASVTANGYGQLEEGQSATIKLKDYPYRDFGVILAILKNKSKINQDSIYYVDVDLPYGLKTNTGKNLEYYYNMSGTIEFTTKKMSLMERILNIITKLNHD